MKTLIMRICLEDDRDSVIKSEEQIYVPPATLLTYKIPTGGKPSPCKIIFKYHGQKMTEELLQVYMSQHERVPSKS